MTDMPLLRSRQDWRIFQVLMHLAVLELSPEVGDKPHFSWKYCPGSPPTLEEGNRRHYCPGAMREWTICTLLGLITLYEQHEVRDVPVVRRKR